MKTYKIYRVFEKDNSWLNIAYAIDGEIEIIESYNGAIKDGYKYDDTLNFDSNMTNATSQEITFFTSLLVPTTITRMALKIQLLLKGIEISEIMTTINSIPSSMFPDVAKKIAIIKFDEAAYFDRYNADLQLVATLMGLSQTDLDDIFINGNKL